MLAFFDAESALFAIKAVATMLIVEIMFKSYSVGVLIREGILPLISLVEVNFEGLHPTNFLYQITMKPSNFAT